MARRQPLHSGERAPAAVVEEALRSGETNRLSERDRGLTVAQCEASSFAPKPGSFLELEVRIQSTNLAAQPECSRGSVEVVGEGRILLVEDEDVVRRTGAKLLESLGYSVLTASNGREGVELFSDHHAELELVLLDMIMPEMNGHDAFAAMKDIDADVPIVVCSGYAADEAVRSLRDQGLAGFLPKPYRRSSLAEIIGQARRSAAP